MIRLKDNMIETEGAIQYITLRNFTEAPWIHKYNDTYYLSYASEWPEYIDYATSDSPSGPWTRRGRIITTQLPSETSHQSIITFKDKWYMVYHNTALPGGGPYKRSVCIDELYYDVDGSIKTFEMTKEGVSPLGAGPVENDAPYQLISCLNNKSVDIRDSTTGSRANVRMETTDNNDEGQLWTFESVGNGVYKIVNVKSGMCMSVESNSTKGEANVEQRSWENAKAQKWKLVGAADSGYAIINLASGKCLDILDLSTADGANIIIWDYWYSSNQQWILKKVPTTGNMAAYHQGTVFSDDNHQRNMRVMSGEVFNLPRLEYTSPMNVHITDLLESFNVSSTIMRRCFSYQTVTY